MSFEEFIMSHMADDTSKLLLAKDRWPDVDVPLAVSTIEGRRALAKKLPSWMAFEGLRFPDRLCTEQCSSETTAAYKASLAWRICADSGSEARKGITVSERAGKSSHPSAIPAGSPRIADLTGGLGADSAAFAARGFSVLHNEMNPVLSESVAHNFALMGISHVCFRNMELVPGCLNAVLEGFNPDIIFLDPARRSGDGSGRKVFRLADCSPDVQALRDELFSRSRHLLLKLSPMADISQVCLELGPACREVHAVEYGGECKELLIWMDREHDGGYTISAVDALADSRLSFDPRAEKEAAWLPFTGQAEGRILFEPGKALMKTGMYRSLSRAYSLEKLDRNTHLYICDSLPETLPATLGKCFVVKEAVKFSGQAIKDLARRYPRCELTSRNLPLSSDDLRKRMGAGSGGDVHIFAAMTSAGKMLFVTEHKTT
ncbi:MAG: hypothetical protein HUJ94_05705 [Bacteroidales bacterium]|nr:hypothetical protein [Bacteroidales bacterium]